MLDTDVCIALIRGRPEALRGRMRTHPPSSPGVSTITVSELRYGAAKSNDPGRNGNALDAFLLGLEVAPFDQAAADIYGEVRADLEQRGQPIGSMDLLIAAHALSLGATLITHNIREFTRVQGLHVTDWLADGDGTD